MNDLTAKIEARSATIGVVGLGYVGTSVAVAFADVGFRVLGVELSAQRVTHLKAGLSPIEGIEPGLAELVGRIRKSGKLSVTQDYDVLRDADVVLICVDTPVARDDRPRFESLRSACRALGRVMKAGTLVIVESTVAPGTTMGLVADLLERHSGLKLDEVFTLGHSPERVMPGKLVENIRNLPRVCGGSTEETTRTMKKLYGHIVHAQIDETDCLTAELTKTAENAFRDVNIAFANTLGLICESVGADFRRVRDLVNKSPGRNMLYAGGGVGGPCLPKDPWLLVHGEHETPTPLIAAARALNDSMPVHVAQLVEDALDDLSVSVSGARIAILGYSYLENCDEVRNSPSAVLIDHLTNWGATCVIHDPWVSGYNRDLWDVVRGAQAAVIMVAHAAYEKLDLERLRNELKAPVLVDGRHIVETEAALRAGFTFRAVGRGVAN